MKVATGSAALFLAVLLAASASASAGTLFLKVPGITGESSDAQHVGWMEIRSFAFQVSKIPLGPGARRGAAYRSTPHFAVTKGVDRASPALAMALARGTHFASMEIEVPGMRYVFADVMVDSYQESAAGAGGLGESVDFAYASSSALPVPVAPGVPAPVFDHPKAGGASGGAAMAPGGGSAFASAALVDQVRQGFARAAGDLLPAVQFAETGGVVTLSGTVRTQDDRVRAERVVRSTQGVSAVVNNLQIQGPHVMAPAVIAPRPR